MGGQENLGDTTAATRFQPGILIGGKFTLIKYIAGGGHGVVYEAEDNLIGRRVAVKLLQPEAAAHAEVVHRFMREARALGKLEHPNVVTILEMGRRRDGSYYIVQELLHGPNLRMRLAEKPRHDLTEVAEILLPIMGALVAAHRLGIVHRDIKPENIVLSRTAAGEIVPKLIDFGVAKAPQTPAFAAPDAPVGMFETKGVLGTLEYVAPEQVETPGAVDGAADVWAMGVVLFELLSGQRPWKPLGFFKEAAPRLEPLVPGIAQGLADIVYKTFERDRAKRPSMEALRDRVLALSGFGARAAVLERLAGSAAVDSGYRQESLLPIGPVETLDPDEVVIEELEEIALDSTEPINPQGLRADKPRPGSKTPPADRSGGVARAQAPADMEWTLELPPPSPDLTGVLAAEHALSINALGSALTYAEQAASMGRAGTIQVARMKLIQSIAHGWLGDYAASERCALEAKRVFRRGTLPWYAAAGHLALAAGHLGKREHLNVLARDLKTIEGAGHVSGAHMVASCRLVVSLFRTGAAIEGQEVFQGALRRAAKYATAEPLVQAWLSAVRAHLALHDGDPMRYMRHVSLSVESFAYAGDVRNTCAQQANIGDAYLQFGGYRHAEEELRKALGVAEPMRLGFVAPLRANLGFALARRRALDEALAVESAALQQCERQGYRRFEHVGRIYMALIHSLRGELDVALGYARAAIDGSADFPGIQAYALATLAGLLLIQDKPEAALLSAQRAMDTLDRLGGVEEGESQIRVVYASALYSAGKHEEALRRIREASARLHERAGRISDMRWRRSFLEEIPENARTLRLAARWEPAEP
jgi:serine/threonine protein kinase/tetratricopeptide (TPR) repeat protein